MENTYKRKFFQKYVPKDENGRPLRVIGSKADVGSSKHNISGDIHNALAIATLCFCPPQIMFAREVADKVIFLDGGKILEYGDAKELIDNPKEQRTKDFMDKILKA